MEIDKLFQVLKKSNFTSEVVGLTQELVKVPSLSAQEGRVAQILTDAMKRYNFDKAWIDDCGNAVGLIKGGSGKSVLFNGHLDCVDVGSMEEPYSAKIIHGSEYGYDCPVLYGRGTCDMKGALASMVVGCGLLKTAGVEFPGDVYVTGVVLEELSGSPGSQEIVDQGIICDITVIGEPSRFNICLGHRSSMHFDVIFRGRTAHASSPQLGINAMEKLNIFFSHLKEIEEFLPEHELLGRTTYAPCNIVVKPGNRSVIPDYSHLSINFRGTPNFNVENARELLLGILKKAGLDGEVMLAEGTGTSYTGKSVKMTGTMLPFYTAPDLDEVNKIKSLTEGITGSQVNKGFWNFATDGGVFHKAGSLVIGVGPGNENYAHTPNEHISIGDLEKAVQLYGCIPFKINS